MSRRPRQPRWAPKPPPGLRPKLNRGQVRDLGLAHLANVDAIARGAGTPEILWQHLGGALTWLFAAELMSARNPEPFAEALRAMQAATVACQDLAQRYKRTGRVAFTGPELQMAREAVEWMDALAEVVDKDVAIQAAEMSEHLVNHLEAGGEAPATLAFALPRAKAA